MKNTPFQQQNQKPTVSRFPKVPICNGTTGSMLGDFSKAQWIRIHFFLSTNPATSA
jgi:hypothetical protein